MAWSRHQLASKVAVPADILGGDAMAEIDPSKLSDALAVRTLAMTEFLLRQLGATSEQVDRKRARIRSEFFSGSKDNEPLPQDRLRPPSEAETQTQEHESAGRG